MFVAWMKWQHPQHRVIAIPNGGLRNIVTAVRMKKEGVAKGIPDMVIISLKLFIEMKRIKGGALSEEQKDWIKYIKSCGFYAEVCYGFEDAKLLIEKIMIQS